MAGFNLPPGVSVSDIPGCDGSEPRYPEIVFELDLDGPDGNIFVVIGHIRRALRRAGVDGSTIDAFTAEVLATTSYHAALRVCGEWVTMPSDED